MCVRKLCRSLDGARAVEGLGRREKQNFPSWKNQFLCSDVVLVPLFSPFRVSLWLTSARGACVRGILDVHDVSGGDSPKNTILSTATSVVYKKCC